MHEQPLPTTPVVKLAAKVAHELNNPLDAVLRLVCLAQRKAQSGNYADVDRHLADAQLGLQRMAEILRELMDVGRQSHEVAPRQQVLLLEMIHQATRTVSLQAEQKHVALRIADPVPEVAHDPRLSQVLANLFKNAVDAAPEHSVIQLDAARADGALEIMIRDQGPGIDPLIFPHLFTAFMTTKPRGQGHGLGLVISRELIGSLGGTLTIANIQPTGCLATIVLPIRQA